MHPVIPWQLRTVMNECVVDGYQIPPKTYLLIGQTASHYDGRLFKDPLEFDIDRYLPERAENYRMRMNPFPTASPDKRLKFRVAEVTHAL